MGRTGVSLTGSARREKASEAYRLAIRRVTYTEIGKALDLSRQLVSNLVQEEQERIWSGRDLSELDGEKRRAIETYEAVIRGAWQRLGRVKDSSLNVSGLFNNIISAQSKIDEITGVRVTTVGDEIARKALAYLDLLENSSGEAEDLSE